MPKTLQFRRDTTANLAAVTGSVGELFVDTDKDTVVVMDGSTAGGKPLATENYANTGIILAQTAYNQGNSTATVANTDFTTLSTTALTIGGVTNSGTVVQVPVISIAANGRIRTVFTESANILSVATSVASWPVANTTGSNGPTSVRIGREANASSAGEGVIAIGDTAAQFGQGNNAIAIGKNAGVSSQGANSIAIGTNAARYFQQSNSIVLNGAGEGGRLGIPFQQVVTNSGLYIDPIRSSSLYGGILYHDSVTKEITKSTTLSADDGYLADLYFANNIITPANTGAYATETQPVIINGELNVLRSLGVGTTPSGVVGEIRAANNVTAFYSSDIKFKENVQTIPDALSKVECIGGKTFDWTYEYIKDHGGEDGYFVQKEDFGVIAQDVQQVFPQAVRTRPDGSLAVDYSKLAALAFAAIVELSEKVKQLETK
jgi:hypothetical protein